jgi:polyisoprenyl-teichoic acid--peptidoglycan teichoic acid transferase
MKKLKRQIYKYSYILKPALLIIGLLIFFLLIKIFLPSINNLFDKSIKGPKLAYSLLTADTSSLKDSNNRINILLLGVSGGEHFGSDLTDTMIFMSIEKSNADTVMLSIPRDIWLDSLQAKVNTAYHYGQQRGNSQGFVLAKDAVYEILNQPIHYAILVDFEGFEKVVDILGGLEVKVDRAFDDYKYPIAGRENDDCGGDLEYQCRYEYLHFEAGLQHMDGRDALRFVRSRNAEGEEGTDIARSQRQQKIILALKDKIIDLSLLFKPKKIRELKQALGDNVKPDAKFSDEQITAFLSLAFRFIKNNNTIRTITLDYGDNENLGFLYNPPLEEYNQWVLIPRNDSFSNIHKYIEDKIYKGY